MPPETPPAAASTERDYVVRQTFSCGGRELVAGEAVTLDELPQGAHQSVLRRGWIEPVATASPLVTGDALEAVEPPPPGELEAIGLDQGVRDKLAKVSVTTRAGLVEYVKANQGPHKAGLTSGQAKAVFDALEASKPDAGGKTNPPPADELEALGLSKSVRELLTKRGVTTQQALADFMEANPTPEASGLGPGQLKAVVDALEASKPEGDAQGGDEGDKPANPEGNQ